MENRNYESYVNKRSVIILAICIVTFLTFIDLLFFVNEHKCDFPGADQLGYYEPLYNQKGVIEGFFHQMGSHFLGVGYFTSWITAQLSNFSVGAEGYLVAILMLINLVLALTLKWRLAKSWEWYDIFLPLVFLNPLHSEVYLNFAHGSVSAMPIMSVLLFAHITLIQSATKKALTLGILFFFSAFTGYAFITSALAGAYTLILLFKSRWAKALWLLLITELAVLILFICLYNYKVLQNSACLFTGGEISYLKYTLNLLRGFFRATLEPTWVMLMLGVGMTAPLAVSVFFGRRKLKKAFYTPVFFLLIFSAIYIVLNVYSRSCGLDRAFSPRYGIFLIPGFIAVYFIITQASHRNRLLHHISLLLFVSTFLFFRLRPNETFYNYVRINSDKLKSWYECYEKHSNTKYCREKTGIGPFGKEEIISSKIERLKKLQEND